jgi:hypothetical protein
MLPHIHNALVEVTPEHYSLFQSASPLHSSHLTTLRQANSTAIMPFKSLSAELCVQVYHHIVEATSLPTFHTLRDYQGLILSSEPMYSEFKCEAIGHKAHLQSQIQQRWQFTSPLRMIPPTQLSDSSRIPITIPIDVLSYGQVGRHRSMPISLLDTLWTYLLNHVSTLTAVPYNPSDTVMYELDMRARLLPLYRQFCDFIARMKGEM